MLKVKAIYSPETKGFLQTPILFPGWKNAMKTSNLVALGTLFMKKCNNLMKKKVK
jgi:hypothetical protein